MIRLKNSNGYMIYEQFSITSKKGEVEVVERSLLHYEVLCNSLSRFEEFKSAYVDKNLYQSIDTKFVVKRKLFFDPRSISSDPIDNALLYHQVFNFFYS